jgi:hypothetical protein
MLEMNAVTQIFGRLLILALPAALLLATTSTSCGPSGGPDVEDHWTGPLTLADGMAYDVELDLEQEEDGEVITGNGVMIAQVAGEADAPVEVVEGSRLDGEEITRVLRDTVAGVLNVRLNGTVEDERIDARGTYRGGGFDLQAVTELTR